MTQAQASLHTAAPVLALREGELAAGLMILIWGQQAFCEGPESRYLKLCMPYSLSIQLCHCSVQAIVGGMSRMGVALPIKHYLPKQAVARFGSWTIICQPLIWIFLIFFNTGSFSGKMLFSLNQYCFPSPPIDP